LSLKTKRRAYHSGLIAEIIAALYLMLKGYKILHWRYKTPVGEIDLIATHKDTIVFAEVKQRMSIDEGLLSLTPHMRSRIHRAALFYISNVSKQAQKDMRFDLIAVTFPCTLHHLDNAWQTQ
jgi:putative endonuclease